MHNNLQKFILKKFIDSMDCHESSYATETQGSRHHFGEICSTNYKRSSISPRRIIPKPMDKRNGLIALLNKSYEPSYINNAPNDMTSCPLQNFHTTILAIHPPPSLHSKLFMDSILFPPTSITNSTKSSNWLERINDIHALVVDQLKIAKTLQSHYADRNRVNHQFKVAVIKSC